MHDDKCKFEEAKPALELLINDYDERLNALYDIVTKIRDLQVEGTADLDSKIDELKQQFNTHLLALGNLGEKLSGRDADHDARLCELEEQISEFQQHLDNGWKADLLERLMGMIENQLGIRGAIRKTNAEGIWRLVVTLLGASGILYLLLDKLMQ